MDADKVERARLLYEKLRKEADAPLKSLGEDYQRWTWFPSLILRLKFLFGDATPQINIPLPAWVLFACGHAAGEIQLQGETLEYVREKTHKYFAFCDAPGQLALSSRLEKVLRDFLDAENGDAK